MTTAALLQRGPSYVADLQSELTLWLAERGYESVAQAKGSAAWATGPDPVGFERSQYHEVLQSGDHWV
jgi:dihydroorotate dehydrogenase (fumarate)